MPIVIKYFGAIAEATGLEEERLDIEEINTDISTLENFFKSKYDNINDLSFQVAVNQSIANEGTLKDGDEIALLPPFAGG